MTNVIAVEDHRGLTRVRMGQTTQRCAATVTHGGVSHPLRIVSTQFLDGHEFSTQTAGDYYLEEELPFDVIPARSKDIADFGRLAAAARSLAMSMAGVLDPSPEQIVVFAQGVANLAAWRERARDAMAQAEGQIEVAETMLAQML